MSPSTSCAWSVIPTANVPSASLATHSCVSVYFSCSGVFMIILAPSIDQNFSVADERRLHHVRRELPAAHRHLHRRADLHAQGNARQRDRALERRRKRAAGDLALSLRGGHFLVA